MNDVVIEELILPDTVGGEGWDVFEELIALRNWVESQILGTDAVSVTPEGILPYFGDNPQRKRRHFTARIDGDMVARAILGWPTTAEAKEARINIDVLPEHRRRGIGSALLGRLESLATEMGRDVLQTDQAHTTKPGGRRIASPTGFGDLPANDPGASFLVAHGYTLEMIVRISSLDPRAARQTVESQLKVAEEQAGADYQVVKWIGPTPDAWLEDMAVLKTGMTTDAPMAGMEMAPDSWDAKRVREHGLRQQATGRALLTAAAEHVPSGRLVAFTEIQVDPGPAPYAVQEDTLVLRKYRGHRLGLLLKAANMGHLLDVNPGATVITTFNAEDNRPMLDVNEALGFVPIGLEGEWQKRV